MKFFVSFAYIFLLSLFVASCQINNNEDENLQPSQRVSNKDYILILSGVPQGMCETLHCDSIKCNGEKSLFPHTYREMTYQEIEQQTDCNFFGRSNSGKTCETVDLSEGSSSCAYGFNSKDYGVNLDEIDQSDIDASEVISQIESR